MQTLSVALEIKALDETGVFEGYGSVFGVRDLGGDIVERGAFAKTLKERGARGVKMLADHDPTKRVGVWETLAEDEKGLHVRGRLLVAKSIGAEALIDLKAGALDGLSIGYRVRSDAMDGRRRARVLKEVDLLEISLVPFPMNEAARVTAVKAADWDWREVEAALREQGLSRADAVKAVSGFKAYLQRDAGDRSGGHRDDAAAAEIRAITERFRAFSNKI